MWPDNETTEDLIGFQVHADLIRKVVADSAMLPVTIGLFGDWGGGKSSVMQMLARDLDPDRWPAGSAEGRLYESAAVVYANTWLFEGYEDAKTALIACVLVELSEHKRFGPKVRDGVLALLKSVHWLRVGRLGLKYGMPIGAAFLTGGAAAVPGALAAVLGVDALVRQSDSSDATHTATSDSASAKEKDEDWSLLKADAFRRETLDVRTFRSRFGKLLKDAGITSLVVLLDDLDRCSPDRIVDNLEAVKLFLSVPQTAFVIGADRRVVEHAIRLRYAERAVSSANDELTSALVKDYLEKLVQVPYSLPRLSPSEIETYMTLLFCERHLPPEDRTTCLKACADARARNRYVSFGYGAVRAALQKEELPPELRDSLAFSASCAPLITDSLKGNPRQVKRFLNALLLRKELARVARLDHIVDAVLVKLMILEYAHADLFMQLFAWQSERGGRAEQLAKLEAALAPPKGNVNDEDGAKKVDARWAVGSVRRWVAMEPFLADVDLRDYFWIARDRLESTFAGISMVPPMVRAVLDGLMGGVAAKRGAATRTAAGLDADERGILFRQIEDHVVREPDKKTGYDALVVLADAGVAGAAESLAGILSERPLDRVPAAVGMDFMTLYRARPGLQAALERARVRLLESATRAGKAAQEAK